MSPSIPVPVPVPGANSASNSAAAVLVVQEEPPRYQPHLPYTGLTPSPSYHHPIGSEGQQSHAPPLAPSVSTTHQRPIDESRELFAAPPPPISSDASPTIANSHTHPHPILLNHHHLPVPVHGPNSATASTSSPSHSPDPNLQQYQPSPTEHRAWSQHYEPTLHSVAESSSDHVPRNPSPDHPVSHGAPTHPTHPYHFQHSFTTNHERLPSYKPFSVRTGSTITVNISYTVDTRWCVVHLDRAGQVVRIGTNATPQHSRNGHRPNTRNTLHSNSHTSAPLNSTRPLTRHTHDGQSVYMDAESVPACTANALGPYHDFVDDFTCMGVLCAVLLFPCKHVNVECNLKNRVFWIGGLWCCFACRERKCFHCGYVLQ